MPKHMEIVIAAMITAFEERPCTRGQEEDTQEDTKYFLGGGFQNVTWHRKWKHS